MKFCRLGDQVSGICARWMTIRPSVPELGQLYTRIEYVDEMTSDYACHFFGMSVRRLVGFRSIPWKRNEDFSYLQ